jgi:uncharacterized protein
MYDCQQCGACCISPSMAYGYVRLAVVELMRLNRLGLPVIAEERSMHLGTRPYYGTGGERICTAFDGRVGQRCGCSIYGDRPGECRKFSAGSLQCQAARAEAGLRN